MAATVLAVYPSKISAIGSITTATPDTTNGNKWANTGREILLIQTQSASGITATIAPQSKFENAIPVSSPSYAVGASALVALGPFNPGDYNDASGNVTVQWSGASGTVAVTVIHLPISPQ
jgi:hypothetical protein